MELIGYPGSDGAVAGPVREAIEGDPRVARILRCIDDRLEDPGLGCTLLQAAFHVSRPTLYRMFQPLGGVSRYIRERRLLAARRRLRDEPDRSITWLLYDLGFESERQFQRAFHARFGMSPAQWRLQSRRREQAPLPV
ncbi:helix-turn-helix domain-containing protein [Luteimonas deserti]|uniref:Helix-turn-helix transcriptional regulator n=1 Tax=Luteimonas deserti TaxID=2752306 RepID=A0A7Z0TXA5_9GAMM|nr:helix-turn-helix transcriptional regulator [Luteimonas deserti]